MHLQNSTKKLIISFFLVLLVLIVSLLFYRNFFVRASPYVAIFLTNGQVYFGHLQHLDNTTITLNDVFYLQASNVLEKADSKKDTNLQISLVKLGKEFHEPRDIMMINRHQVLFWEELKGTGKVAEAIRAYKIQE